MFGMWSLDADTAGSKSLPNALPVAEDAIAP